MKLAKKIVLLTFSLLLIIIAGGDSDGQGRGGRELVILFTHDLHSYLLPHQSFDSGRTTSTAGRIR